MTHNKEPISILLADGAVTEVHRFGVGPRVLFTHGAGLAIGAFAPFIKELSVNFEVFAFDLRGHGRGPAVDVDSYDLELLAQDFGDVVDGINTCIGEQPLFGVFHSFGGVLAMRAQATRRNLFEKIVLLEPPLGGIGEQATHFLEHKIAFAERAAKRRNSFKTVAEFASRIQSAGLVTVGERATTMADALLKPTSSGHFELRCSPAVESKTYATNNDFGLWSELQNIGCRGVVMVGSAGGYAADIAPVIAAAADFELLHLPDLGHFAWIETPIETAALVSAALSENP